MSIDFNEGGSYINITLNEKSATLTLPPIHALTQLSRESRRDLFVAFALHAYLMRGFLPQGAAAEAIHAAETVLSGMEQVQTVTSNINKAP